MHSLRAFSIWATPWGTECWTCRNRPTSPVDSTTQNPCVPSEWMCCVVYKWWLKYVGFIYMTKGLTRFCNNSLLDKHKQQIHRENICCWWEIRLYSQSVVVIWMWACHPFTSTRQWFERRVIGMLNMAFVSVQFFPEEVFFWPGLWPQQLWPDWVSHAAPDGKMVNSTSQMYKWCFYVHCEEC